MAVVKFRSKGAFTSGTGALTPAIPAGYAKNDIFLLFVESANEAIAAPTGWTQVTNSPQSTGTAAAAGGVRLGVFWKRAAATGETAPSVADTGDHTCAQIFAYSGCVVSGNPWDITGGGVLSSAGTTVTLTGVTTTVANTLVVMAVASDRDAASTTNFSSWANGNLTSVVERDDNTVIAGAGGGLGIAEGYKATAGATGNSTVTQGASVTAAWMHIALSPETGYPSWVNQFVLADGSVPSLAVDVAGNRVYVNGVETTGGMTNAITSDGAGAYTLHTDVENMLLLAARSELIATHGGGSQSSAHALLSLDATVYYHILVGQGAFGAPADTSHVDLATVTTEHTITLGSGSVDTKLRVGASGISGSSKGVANNGTVVSMSETFPVGIGSGSRLLKSKFGDQSFGASGAVLDYFVIWTDGSLIGDSELAALTVITTNYSMTATLGTLALTGIATGVKFGHNMPAAVGARTLTGIATGLQFGHKLVATVSPLALTGIATGLRSARTLAIVKGALVVTWPSQASVFGRRVPAALGALTLTGNATALRATRTMPAAVGALVVTGVAVNLGKGFTLVTSALALALTGVATALRSGRRVTAVLGTMSIGGQAVALRRAATVPIAAGALALSGVAVGLKVGRKIAAGLGSLALSGPATSLSNARKLVAAAGAMVLTGVAANLVPPVNRRTNLVHWSTDPSQAYWLVDTATKSGVSGSASTAIGSVPGQKITSTGALSAFFTDDFVYGPITTHTFSAYVWVESGSGTAYLAAFDDAAGQLTGSTFALTTTPTRQTFTFTPGLGHTYNNVSIESADGAATHFVVAGLQLESGPVATALIRTDGSPRSAWAMSAITGSLAISGKTVGLSPFPRRMTANTAALLLNGTATFLAYSNSFQTRVVWKGNGASVNGTADVVVPLPTSYAKNDYWLLAVESANEVVAAPAGWTQVVNSPNGIGTAGLAGDVRLSVFERRVAGYTGEVAPTILDVGDHLYAQIFAFSGCVRSGSAIDASAGGAVAASTAITLGSITPGSSNTTIVMIVATDRDVSGTDAFSGWANSTLTGVTEIADQTVNTGAGGGIGAAVGLKPAPGATGASTVTQASSVTYAWMMLALKPDISVPSWVPIRADGSIPAMALNRALNRTWVDGVETTGSLAAMVTADGDGAYSMSTALATFLQRSALTGVIETIGGAQGFLLSPDADANYNYLGAGLGGNTVVQVRLTVGTPTGIDMTATLGGGGIIAPGNTLKTGWTAGEDGVVRIAANAGAANSAGNTLLTSAATGGKVLKSKYGDFNFGATGATLERLTLWADQTSISNAQLQAATAVGASLGAAVGALVLGAPTTILRQAHRLSAVTSALALTGVAPLLTKQIASTYTLHTTVGALALTGIAPTLRTPIHRMAAAPTAMVLNGITTTLTKAGSSVLGKPTPVPASWAQRYRHDFKGTGVISLNHGQTVAAIDADTGIHQQAGFFYRPGLWGGGTANGIGIAGFGNDAFVDPDASTMIFDYLKERPTGEIEMIPGAGARYYSRLMPNSASQTLLTSQFPDVNGAISKNHVMRSSALTNTWRKLAGTPPFAVVTWYIAWTDDTDQTFGAPMWHWENDSTPEATAPLGHLEYDSCEYFGGSSLGGSGPQDLTTSFHSTPKDYTAGRVNFGDVRGTMIGVLTLFDTSAATTYFSNNGGSSWTQAATTTLAAMNGAPYAQKHIAFIHNISSYIPWQGATADLGAKVLYADFIQEDVYAPLSNAGMIVPTVVIPAETLATINPPFSAGLIDSTSIGTVIGTINLPGGAASARIITAGGRLAISGTNIIVASTLNFTDQPTLKFAVETIGTDGGKAVGRWYQVPVTAGAAPTDVSWARAGYAIDIDIAGNRVADHGSRVALSTVKNGNDLIGIALAFMQRTNGMYVVEFAHPGGAGVMNIMSTSGDFSEATTTGASTFIYRAANTDTTVTLASGAVWQAGKLYKVGVGWGSASPSVIGGINGQTPVLTSAKAHTAAGARAVINQSIFGDRTGLVVSRITMYEDASIPSAATVQARTSLTMSASTGVLTMTGVAATLTRSTANNAYRLTAVTLPLAVNTSVLFRVGKVLTAVKSTMVMANPAVALRATRQLHATVGALVQAGPTPILRSGRTFGLAAGSLVLTGAAAGLGLVHKITVSPLDLILTGSTAGLIKVNQTLVRCDNLIYVGFAPRIDVRTSPSPAADHLQYSGLAPSILGLPEPIDAIPPVNNLEQLRQTANEILATLQAATTGAGTVLPDPTSEPEGRLFVRTDTQTLYQIQGGQWVAVDMVP